MGGVDGVVGTVVGAVVVGASVVVGAVVVGASVVVEDDGAVVVVDGATSVPGVSGALVPV